jgi:hypothetical protein
MNILYSNIFKSEQFYNLNIFPTKFFYIKYFSNSNRYEKILNKNRIEYEESRTGYWAAFGTARCTCRQSGARSASSYLSLFASVIALPRLRQAGPGLGRLAMNQV